MQLLPQVHSIDDQVHAESSQCLSRGAMLTLFNEKMCLASAMIVGWSTTTVAGKSTLNALSKDARRSMILIESMPASISGCKNSIDNKTL